MKKITTLILLLTTVSTIAFAQGIYFKAGGGYALPIATQPIGENYLTKYTSDGNVSTYDATREVVTASYGAGTNFFGGAGYMFNEFLGVELNIQYTMGKKFETSDVYTYDDPSYSEDERTIVENSSQALFINPSFIVTPGAGRNVPYGRFGFVAGAPSIKGEETYTDKISYYPDPYTGSRKWEYSGGFTLGFQGAVGMNWMLSDKIDLFTEVNFVSMTYYPDEYNLTEYIQNGYDYMPDTQPYYKKTIYKDKINAESEPDTSKPREALREGTAFSSLSLQVGISFLLNGHGEN